MFAVATVITLVTNVLDPPEAPGSILDAVLWLGYCAIMSVGWCAATFHKRIGRRIVIARTLIVVQAVSLLGVAMWSAVSLPDAGMAGPALVIILTLALAALAVHFWLYRRLARATTQSHHGGD